MRVAVLKIEGMDEALFGLGLSYGLTDDISFIMFQQDHALMKKMENIASKLAHKPGGHNKFLESIVLWIDVDAPRYWWSEMDTYRVGITKQSASTMHTIRKRPLVPEDFESVIRSQTLDYLNKLINGRASIVRIKGELPESFLQRRIICTNAKVIQHIIEQRRGHKLPEWTMFIECILEGWKDFGFAEELLEAQHDEC